MRQRRSQAFALPEAEFVPHLGKSAPIREAKRSRRRTDTSVIHGHWPDRSDVVGVGRFELPASCSQSGNTGVSVRVGLCVSVSECIGLAGVMGAQTDTERTGRHSPVLPELIHL